MPSDTQEEYPIYNIHALLLMVKVKNLLFKLKELPISIEMLTSHLFTVGEEMREEKIFCEPFLANTTGENIFY